MFDRRTKLTRTALLGAAILAHTPAARAQGPVLPPPTFVPGQPLPSAAINQIIQALQRAVYPGAAASNVALINPTIEGPPLSLGSTGADQFTNSLALNIGGQAIQQFGTMPNPGAPSSLNVFGSPRGSYAAGCSLCVISTRNSWNAARAAISGIDYREGVAAIDGMGFFDEVGLYNYTDNLQALMVLQVASYDATHVYLATPMTAAQMAQLQLNTYIETNSIDPTVSTAPALIGFNTLSTTPGNTLPIENYFKGIISGWDPAGMWISVAAWAASHSTNTAPGQVPPLAPLDTVWSKYASPVVFVGAPTGITGLNNYIYYDGSRSGGSLGTNAGNGTALSHWLQSEETDIRYTASVPHEVRITGPTISGNGIGGVGAQGPTADSFLLQVAGDLPTMLVLNGTGASSQITGSSFYVHGAEGVQTFGGVSRPLITQFAFTGYADGVNAMSFIGYMKHDNATLEGWAGVSMHFGGQVDGSILTPGSGGNFGELVLNRNASNAGGVSLCGGTGACGLDVSTNGAVSLNQTVTVNGSLVSAAGQTFSMIDAANDNQHPYLVADSPDILAVHTNLPNEIYGVLKAKALQTQVYTVATLPGCTTSAEGQRSSVSDANAPNFLGALSGGGTVHAPVYCNGTTWVPA